MMGSMYGRAGLIRFALIAVLMASVACTGGSDPVPNLSTAVNSTPTGSSSPPVSSSAPPSSPYPADVPLTGHNVKPGEKPPLYPIAAKVKSQAGANAFAEFFMRTLDWAYATTNPSYMKHYYASSCGLCSGIATGITKTAAQHHWYVGGRLTIRSVSSSSIAQITAAADNCSSITTDITSESVVDLTGKIFDGEGAHLNLAWKLCTKWQNGGQQVTYFAGLS
ncbi:MAG: DUF6318 family protein [Jatrophihabitans sp.]